MVNTALVDLDSARFFGKQPTLILIDFRLAPRNNALSIKTVHFFRTSND